MNFRTKTGKIVISAVVFWFILSLFLYSRFLGKVDNKESSNGKQIMAVLNSHTSKLNKVIALQQMLKKGQENQPIQEQEIEIIENTSDSFRQIPIVIFTCSRAEYLKKSLDTIFKYNPSLLRHPVYISQDGYDKDVQEVVDSFGKKISGHFHKAHSETVFEKPISGPKVYYHIAQHFKFGINAVFDDNEEFEHIIILEEDIEISSDFFEYFTRLSYQLDSDPSLYCVSSYNDNGMLDRIDLQDIASIKRSDFFPGLGWMIRRELWEQELNAKWPLGFWDDWLRLPKNRKGRACLRPVISRTYTYGVKGASGGQFSSLLSRVKLNSIPIDWTKIDLSYLNKDFYDKELTKKVKNAKKISLNERDKYNFKGESFKIEYSSKNDFQRLAKQLNIFDDEKSGVPRTAYKGIVEFTYNLNTFFLVPSRSNLLYKNE